MGIQKTYISFHFFSMRVAFILALVLIASVHTASPRRAVSVPAPIKKAFGQVWGAVKGDLAALGKCMAGAAKGMAIAAVKAKLPNTAGAFLSMVGLRRLFSIKGMARKAAGMAKKGACAAFGKKGLDMCKQGVAAGVGKAAGALKGKMPNLDTTAAQGCLKAFGNSLCDKAFKKACGRL